MGTIELLKLDQIDQYVDHLARHLPEPGIDGIISQPFPSNEAIDKENFRFKILQRWSTKPTEGAWEVAWGLFVDGKIVGHIELFGSKMAAFGHRVKLGMGIEQKFRKQGFGKKLLETAIAWARTQEFLSWIDLEVFSHNPVAIKLYESHGFKPVGKTKDRIRVGKMSIDDWHFVLNLKGENGLPEGYSIKECELEEFSKAVDGKIEQVFQDDLIFRVRDALSKSEKSKLKKLNENYAQPYRHHLLMYFKGELAGWTWGFQDSKESFYMVNSAILPEHRRQGLYLRLLDMTLEKLIEKGFQRIWSRHSSTNNSIIVPKLKKGFLITGSELSDAYGSLVHLTYFTNETRRKVMDFRVGQLRPDEELQKIFKL
jgi:ribosomal protein S18 acetylase RimI-like enzyme